ncbi:MAG TPA: transposase [Sedimentisphaerales bacterium]|nr:transposase [Sedimentisphaerales bacterium]
MTARRQFSAQEKVEVLRLHLLEHKPISEVCEQYQLNPTVFYRWQKDLFDHGAAGVSSNRSGAYKQRVGSPLPVTWQPVPPWNKG